MKFALALLLGMIAVPAAGSDWLAAQRWQQRLVIVQGLAAEPMTEVLAAQASALEERTMAVWRLEAERLVWIGGAQPVGARVVEGEALEGLRLRLRGAPQAAGLHLFGLDGGLKASRERAGQLEELIQAVDSMPMRVRELRG